MTIIEIKENCSYTNLNRLKDVYNPSWRLTKVTIDYNVNKGLPRDDCNSSEYPFKAFFETLGGNTIELRIYCLTVGYPGEGPHDTAEILDFLQVPYDKDYILTKNNMDENGNIHIEYHM